jgi:hypothetical protein
MFADRNLGSQGLDEMENASFGSGESDGTKGCGNGEHASQEFHHRDEQLAGPQLWAATGARGNGQTQAKR